jgi:hypothetical protein
MEDKVMKGTRQNLVRGLVSIALCLTIGLTACSTAWIAEAEAIVAALIPAASNLVALVALLEGKSVSTADLQLIQNVGTQAGADLQLVQSLLAQYQKADAATQPALLNQVQASIGRVQSNLSALLPALHIKDTATQAKITAVVGILLSEVQSLAAALPLVNPNAPPAMAAKAAQQAKSQPPLTAAEFVDSFNAILTAKTGNTELDRAAAGLRIHLHSKWVRWGTAGVLK